MSSTIVDIAIGLVLFYALLSLLCTVIGEWLARIMNSRGEHLVTGVKNLLNDPEFTGLSQFVFAHGMVAGVCQNAGNSLKANRLPSYLPANLFATSLLDVISSHGAVAVEPAEWEALRGLQRLVLQVQQNPRRFKLDAQQADAVRHEDWATVANHFLPMMQSDWMTPQLQERISTVLGEPEQRADRLKVLLGRANVGQLMDTYWQAFKASDLAQLGKSNNADELTRLLGVGRRVATSDPWGALVRGVDLLPEGHTQSSLQILLDKARREHSSPAQVDQRVEAFQKHVEGWFDDAMERVSGWYRRKTQVWAFLLGLVMACLMNADTLSLCEHLQKDAALRAGMGRLAQETILTDTDDKKLNHLQQFIGNVSLPVGPGCLVKEWAHDYTQPWPEFGQFLGYKLIGWLLTAVALTFGAPFWFDLLKNVVNLRSSGPVPGRDKG